MASKKRLFLILWIAGICGVLSFLLVDISAVIRAFPLPEGTPPPELPPPALLKLATVFQPAVLTSLAVIIGMWLAPKVGLHAPTAEAIAERRPVWPELRRQLFPGIVSGLLSGIGIVAIWVIAKPFMPAEFVERAVEFNKFIPHAVRILYGGFTEEILLRWGFMTFLVWLFDRIARSKNSGDPAQPQSILFWISIFISAIAFGAGHLPVASALAGGLTIPIAIFVIVGNSIFGIVAGFLYWRSGLEAAMLAHMSAHLVLIAAIALAL
ncbi:MAG: CPBP family glutamic-type intramembrane protease [Pyrinomonadaceae bacterium]